MNLVSLESVENRERGGQKITEPVVRGGYLRLVRVKLRYPPVPRVQAERPFRIHIPVESDPGYHDRVDLERLLKPAEVHAGRDREGKLPGIGPQEVGCARRQGDHVQGVTVGGKREHPAELASHGDLVGKKRAPQEVSGPAEAQVGVLDSIRSTRKKERDEQPQVERKHLVAQTVGRLKIGVIFLRDESRYRKKGKHEYGYDEGDRLSVCGDRIHGCILSRSVRADNTPGFGYTAGIMTAQIIDGKKIAAEIQEELTGRIARITDGGSPPGLAVVLVGEDPASVSYVTAKERDCEKVGIRSFDMRLPESTTETELLELVDRLNGDDQVDGILVQLPLPKHVDSNRVLQRIDPAKDVDGFHPLSLGRMMLGLPSLLPCTPHGVVQMLTRTGHDPSGKNVVIIGRSNIVGKPLASLLTLKQAGGNATVTVCHSRTPEIASHTRNADIVIAAIGSARFLTADMVKPGVVVIDVGVNRVDDPTAKRGYRLVGDVDYDAVAEKASAITPVPGGVGPMTRTMLLHNTVIAAERRRNFTEAS